ncbi:DUF1489 family protein [Coralliovum pocilloporae]|uniref:DUF1489 family protein n=1 Tax=Coralliovum pocilloporae TaxID=3066369 RepID=UPI003306E41F
MAVHLIKLCVGVDTLDDLKTWIDWKLTQLRQAGVTAEQYHTTRMVPKRKDELVEGGSLYWVIKGQIQARQPLLDIRPFKGEDGIGRCHLVLEPTLIETEWSPRRAFQGWRYLKPEDAPRDRALGDDADLPADLRRELADLGLL